MLSKITIDVSESGQPQILIKHIHSDDLRDRLIGRLLNGFVFPTGQADVKFSQPEDTKDGIVTIATLIPVHHPLKGEAFVPAL